MNDKEAYEYYQWLRERSRRSRSEAKAWLNELSEAKSTDKFDELNLAAAELLAEAKAYSRAAIEFGQLADMKF